VALHPGWQQQYVARKMLYMRGGIQPRMMLLDELGLGIEQWDSFLSNWLVLISPPNNQELGARYQTIQVPKMELDSRRSMPLAS
jgi:hypothetical protein